LRPTGAASMRSRECLLMADLVIPMFDIRQAASRSAPSSLFQGAMSLCSACPSISPFVVSRRWFFGFLHGFACLGSCLDRFRVQATEREVDPDHCQILDLRILARDHRPMLAKRREQFFETFGAPAS